METLYRVEYSIYCCRAAYLQSSDSAVVASLSEKEVESLLSRQLDIPEEHPTVVPTYDIFTPLSVDKVNQS